MERVEGGREERVMRKEGEERVEGGRREGVERKEVDGVRGSAVERRQKEGGE